MKRAEPMEADLRVRPHDVFERGQVLELSSSGGPLLLRIRDVRRLPTGSGLLSVRSLGPIEARWYRLTRAIGRAMRWIREAIGG